MVAATDSLSAQKAEQLEQRLAQVYMTPNAASLAQLEQKYKAQAFNLLEGRCTSATSVHYPQKSRSRTVILHFIFHNAGRSLRRFCASFVPQARPGMLKTFKRKFRYVSLSNEVTDMARFS